MIEKLKKLLKTVLKRTIELILEIIGIAAILMVLAKYIVPYYQKNNFMKDCLKDGTSQKKCEEIWLELEKLD